MEITTKDLNELIEANISILLENKDTDKSQDYESIQKKVLKDTKVNFGFIFTFGTAITALYPIIESFIKNDGTLIEYDLKETVVYLTICALAIAFQEAKQSYQKIFEELRLRGAYKFLKPVVAFFNVMKNIFSNIASKTGEVIKGLADMFAYTALFVPFAIIFQDLIALNSVSLDGIISAVTVHGMAKLVMIGVSIGSITAKHFLIDLVNKLKKFNSLAFSNIKKVIDKIKRYTVGQLFGSKEPAAETGDVKRYHDFEGEEEIITEEDIKENKYVDRDEEWGSLGEYVEKFQKAVEGSEEDEVEFIRIIGKHLDSKTDIRVANAVDLLNEYDQRLLVKELEDTFFASTNESTMAEEFVEDIKDNTISGKGGFNSFLKVITALNLPEIKPDVDNCPKNFSIIYSFESINKERLVDTLRRFKSLSSGVRIIDNLTDNIVGIYFGLKFESNRFYIEYGILGDDKRYVVGEFKFGSPQYKKMLVNKSKVLKSFQEEMKDVDLKDLKLLMKIKNDFTNFSPGYFHRKSNAIIKDNVLIQGYYGVGNWNNGVLDKESYDNLKQEFKDWVLTQKWREKVLVNIKPGKFWVYFKIKMS
ncbi:MAG: hypothetical protein SLAVMIC_00310 [uncultured marine phage]|uniref:Uncharacterized protein n=1 Tax=uncultured marine phage TaxID=707152 RepID=A0A8D9CDY1_9VIRU|nr:MAG: hypothetical protein SLAVMIC_00310 [uncultured marine phage]